MQGQNNEKPRSIQEILTGIDPTQYDWRRTVDWTKVINGVVFALVVLASLAICALSGMVRVTLGG